MILFRRVQLVYCHNVECVVLPADLANAPPLLGMSFLNNYTIAASIRKPAR